MSGVALGALAGVGFGLFQAVNRRVNATLDVYRATFALLVVGSLLLVALSIALDDLAALWRAPGRALAAFALAGLVHFLGGWTLLGLSQQRIGAARTGALLGTAPLLGALMAALVLGETLTAVVLTALVVVVVGVGAVALSRRHRDHTPRAVLPGLGLALATAACWAASPLLIRVGLRDLSSPLLGVTVGMVVTTVAYGLIVAALPRDAAQPAARTVLGPVIIAGTLVGLSIWSAWTALGLAEVGVVLAVMQLSAPTVALVAPLVSGDPHERGDAWLWLGLTLIVGGSVALLLLSAA